MTNFLKLKKLTYSSPERALSLLLFQGIDFVVKNCLVWFGLVCAQVSFPSNCIMLFTVTRFKTVIQI